MFQILPLLILLFNTIYYAQGSCATYKTYYLLGKVVNSNAVTKTCKNDTDPCIYVSFSFPGLAIGSISGCSEYVDKDLEDIITRRLDLIDSFKGIFIKNTTSIDNNEFCKRSTDGNQPYLIETMSGKAKFFIHCYDQKKLYLQPGVHYNSPTTSATPVECMNGKILSSCDEGYCGMLEVASLRPNGMGQASDQYQFCPNVLFNQIYFLSKNYGTIYSKVLTDDIHNAGPFCAEQSNFTHLNKFGGSPYFWYINCYVPSSTKNPQFPAIPDLTFFATTTTTSQPIVTTTKIATSSTTLSTFTLILFIIISFVFNHKDNIF